MPRLLVVFLLGAVLLTEAAIPVVLRGRYPSSLSCITKATVANLCGTQCSVADILKATGMEFIDFVNLQNNQLGPLYPTKVLPQDTLICVGGHFTSDITQ